VASTILVFLKKNPLHSYSAKSLEHYLHLNINSIRSELRRLNEKGIILREKHGYYRIKIDGETLYYLEHPPTLLHGIQISMNRVRKLQKGIDTIPAKDCSLDVDDVNRLKANGFVLKTNKRFVHVFNYQDDVDRRITIVVHGMGRIDLYLNCSNHPVNYFEFRDILKHCEGVISFLGLFSNQRVVSFGEAKDFRQVRMSGCNELSLKAYTDHWFRIYNKERLGVARVEQHIKCDVPVSSLLDMFERMFLPVGNGFKSLDNSEGMFR